MFNDGHAGAQVVLALCEKGQEDEQAASGSNTDIEVGKICFKYPFPHLKHHTEQNAQYGAAGTQKHYLQAGDKGKLQIIHDVEIFRLHAREFGDIIGNQGGTDAGYQCGVIHNAHTGDLHGKKGGRHRGAEQRGKSGSHAAHQNDFLVCFIKMEQIPQLFAHTSADLKSSALPPDGTAAEDGDNGGTEDEERHAEGNDDFAVDAFDDRIRPAVILIMKSLVEENNQQTAQREGEEHILVPGAQCGRLVQTPGKKRSKEAHGRPGQGAEKQPPQILTHIMVYFKYICFYPAHE